jgi:Mn2+/Fe2+ NRAMP family transporter
VKLSDIGPGLLLAATGIGVGDMVSSTIAGAEYGLTLVWALAAGVVLKFAITEGAARWQLGTGTTLMEAWRDHLPRAIVLAFFVYFVIWSYFVSSALVAASALVPAAIIPWVPLPVWGFVHAVAAFAMVWFGRYERFLSVIKWFVGLKFGAVIGSVLLIVLWSGADWSHFGAKSALTTSYTLSLIGGVGGTVTLLSYAYWMREAGWSGPRRVSSARADLTLSFGLVFVFCFSMIFLATQISWTGQILEEGPRLCLLLADRIGEEIGPIGRGVFLLGFWGAAFSSVLGVFHGVPFLFDDWFHLWRRETPTGQQGAAYRAWAGYLTLAAISALVIRRPVWLVFAYTVVGSLFFPYVISTLLWLNNSHRAPAATRSGALVNAVLSAALLLYGYLAYEAVREQFLERLT